DEGVALRARWRRHVVAAGRRRRPPPPPADLAAVEPERVLRIAGDLDLGEVAVRREVEILRGEERLRVARGDAVVEPDPLRAAGVVEELVRVEELQAAEREGEKEEKTEDDREAAHQI